MKLELSLPTSEVAVYVHVCPTPDIILAITKKFSISKTNELVLRYKASDVDVAAKELQILKIWTLHTYLDSAASSYCRFKVRTSVAAKYYDVRVKLTL